MADLLSPATSRTHRSYVRRFSLPHHGTDPESKSDSFSTSSFSDEFLSHLFPYQLFKRWITFILSWWIHCSLAGVQVPFRRMFWLRLQIQREIDVPLFWLHRYITSGRRLRLFLRYFHHTYERSIITHLTLHIIFNLRSVFLISFIPDHGQRTNLLPSLSIRFSWLFRLNWDSPLSFAAKKNFKLYNILLYNSDTLAIPTISCSAAYVTMKKVG